MVYTCNNYFVMHWCI